MAINCYRFAHSAEAFSLIDLRPQALWRRISGRPTERVQRLPDTS